MIMALADCEYEALAACDLCGCSALSVFNEESLLHRCNQCGYVFDSPRPTREAIAAYYSRADKYDGWLAAIGNRDRLWMRRLKKLPIHSGRLLDVGTGIGQFLAHVRDRFDVIGTEVSSSARALALERYQLEIIPGELEEIQLDQEFDLITVFHVLEHVPSPRRLLQKCYDLLAPGGYIVVAVPNDVHSVRNAMRKLLGGRALPRITLDDTQGEIHVSHFTQASLSLALTKIGFSDVKLSLDPYFASGGWKLAVHVGHYAFSSVVHRLTGFNLYETILAVARK